MWLQVQSEGAYLQVVSLKRVKHELELKLREQEEELDDQAAQIQQLEQVIMMIHLYNAHPAALCC